MQNIPIKYVTFHMTDEIVTSPDKLKRAGSGITLLQLSILKRAGPGSTLLIAARHTEASRPWDYFIAARNTEES